MMGGKDAQEGLFLNLKLLILYNEMYIIFMIFKILIRAGFCRVLAKKFGLHTRGRK